MSIGILVDSFLVRSILVPSLAASFGRVSWWPNAPPEPEAADRASAPSEAGSEPLVEDP
jgi:RND superfamily putative drug exporter